MIRARFRQPTADYRPVVWPIKHPYWCTGTGGDGAAILVAYADDITEIKTLWPEAYAIDVDEVDGYVFSERFAKPDWLVIPPEKPVDPEISKPQGAL